MTIAVLNTKGGASKSTVALQVAAAYFLHKNQNVDLYEFDDENKDSLNFTYSEIKSKQIKIGEGKDISDILRNSILEFKGENLVIDVGGNKTTTIFIDGLKKSRIFKKIDLIIIPMSGGSQDLSNAIKTYDMVKELDVPILFALSRVTNMNRLKFKYNDFFMYFPTNNYIALAESDVIDLSRSVNKSVYEVAVDKEFKSILEKELDEAFDKNDNEKAKLLSFKYEISGEAEQYLNDILHPAWKTIDALCKE
ncbi:MAG: hypothetical protein PHE73_08415 [Sulfurovaceae bacterium]|nr:hypothetical protein [Sulfurovaceae bacterium]